MMEKRMPKVGYDSEMEEGEEKRRMEWGALNDAWKLERELDYWKRTRAEQGYLPCGGEISDKLAEARSGRLRIKPDRLREEAVIKQILILIKEGAVNVILERVG